MEVGTRLGRERTREQKSFETLSEKPFFSVRLYTIFGKVGRNASEEVILELIRSKCIPMA